MVKLSEVGYKSSKPFSYSDPDPYANADSNPYGKSALDTNGKCIKCGNNINTEAAKYRKGYAAKKCDQCLLLETLERAEIVAGRNGTLKYEEEAEDTVRVSGRIDPPEP